MEKCKNCALQDCKPCYECSACRGGDDHFRPLSKRAEAWTEADFSNEIRGHDIVGEINACIQKLLDMGYTYEQICKALLEIK